MCVYGGGGLTSFSSSSLRPHVADKVARERLEHIAMEGRAVQAVRNFNIDFLMLFDDGYERMKKKDIPCINDYATGLLCTKT